jgi:hypothetical protein
VQNLFDYLEGSSSLEEFLQDFPSVSSRMLKKSASGVLVSLRPSTYRMRFSEVGRARGAFPFAKIY